MESSEWLQFILNRPSRLIISVCLFIICYYHVNLRTFATLSLLSDGYTNNVEDSSLKTILVWNSPHRIETASFGTGHDAFEKNNCPVKQCRIFVERSALPFHLYDAVVMNMHEIHLNILPENEGFNRFRHQRYIFLTQESPQTMPLNPSNYNNYFNWTMSYRLDSDIQLLY